MTDADTIQRFERDASAAFSAALAGVSARARSLMAAPDTAEALSAICAMDPGARRLMFRGVGDLRRGAATLEGMTAVVDLVERCASDGPGYVVRADADRVGTLSVLPAREGDRRAGPREIVAAIRANAATGSRLLEAVEGRMA